MKFPLNMSTKIYLISSIFLYMVGCSPSPTPINYNEDICDYCQMMISNPRYGAELVTQKGKVYKFDSIECLAATILKEKVKEEELYSLWVVNFETTGKLINIDNAGFLYSEKLHSPMEMGLSSFRNSQVARSFRNKFDGIVIDWQSVLKLVNEKWFKKE